VWRANGHLLKFRGLLTSRLLKGVFVGDLVSDQVTYLVSDQVREFLFGAVRSEFAPTS
jgi:hypothetical protein